MMMMTMMMMIMMMMMMMMMMMTNDDDDDDDGDDDDDDDDHDYCKCGATSGLARTCFSCGNPHLEPIYKRYQKIFGERANVVDFDFATSCLFMPLQVACHSEWRMPLQVACRTVSMPLHATSSGVSHREHATSCHFMSLQVACRTVSMPLHATSCHFKWRVAPWACHFMPLQVAWSGEIGLRTSCVLNENLRNNLHLVVGFPS